MDVLRLRNGQRAGYISLYTTFICLYSLSSITRSKQCIQTGPCTCKFDDGTGEINLTPLGRKDNTPLIDQISSSTGSDGYKYSYNPCFAFYQGTCRNVAACQFYPMGMLYYNIGDYASAKLSYDDKDDNIIAEYTSGGDIERKTIVTFKCDSAADKPQCSMNGESPVAVYSFEIISKYACPLSMNATTTVGPSTTGKKECYKTDQCRCEFNDGSGVMDLSTVGRNDGVPLIDREYKSGNFTYSFNPCFPFKEGRCVQAAGCQHDIVNKTLYYNIGDARRVEFHYDGTAVVGTYTSTDEARKSIVKYICNPNMVVPAYQVEGEISLSTYGFTIFGRDLCPKLPTNIGSRRSASFGRAATDKTFQAAYTRPTMPSNRGTLSTPPSILKWQSSVENKKHSSPKDILSTVDSPSFLGSRLRVKIPLKSTGRTDKASTQQAVYTVQAQVVESTFSSTFVATASVSAGILLIILASMSFWTKRYRSLHYKLNEY